MRIAQVAPLYESVPPKLYGGTERVVSYLTEELVRLGHDVTLFATGDSLTSARLIPVRPMALRLDGSVVDSLAHHVVLLEEVFRRKDQFDIVHFHIDYLHFPLSRREGLIHLTTLHGRLDLPDLSHLYHCYADMPVVSISDAQRKPIWWANWLGTVHHGMPEDALSLGEGQGNYLAFLGRISPEKGLDEAIRIAKRAKMKLKIAAKVDPADEEYFETVIRGLLKHPLIEYIGEIGSAEKSAFLGGAAALLFPIQWPEPFGLVMMEAMACGTPVIAYPHGSVPEIIEDGMNGFVVHNVEEAAKAVARLPQLNRLACRQCFEQRFTSRRMTRQYLDIFERLASWPPETLAEITGARVD